MNIEQYCVFQNLILDFLNETVSLWISVPGPTFCHVASMTEVKFEVYESYSCALYQYYLSNESNAQKSPEFFSSLNFGFMF